MSSMGLGKTRKGKQASKTIQGKSREIFKTSVILWARCPLFLQDMNWGNRPVCSLPEGRYTICAFEIRSIHHQCCTRQWTWSPTVPHYNGPEFRFLSLWPPLQGPPESTGRCHWFWRCTRSAYLICLCLVQSQRYTAKRKKVMFINHKAYVITTHQS